MVSVYAVVEGQTEERFLKQLVSQHLEKKNVRLLPQIIGHPRHRGGNVNLSRMRDSVYRTMMEHQSAFCTTMFDYYGLDPDFPGRKAPPDSTTEQKARAVESGLREAVNRKVEDRHRPDRFIPYVQMHEFEGLLFSDPSALAQGISQPELETDFATIRKHFDTPEDINDRPPYAPSKRIIALFKAYNKNKVILGLIAADRMGLAVMMGNCPHFCQWVKTLEALG